MLGVLLYRLEHTCLERFKNWSFLGWVSGRNYHNSFCCKTYHHTTYTKKGRKKREALGFSFFVYLLLFYNSIPIPIFPCIPV